MKVVIHKSDGTVSLMQLFPHSVRRKLDGKMFALNDKIERRGQQMVTNVLAIDPTPLEDLPGDVASAATNIVKIGEVSALKAFGVLRMFEAPVLIFDVIYTPVHEGFKATFDAALMLGETKNDEWEFVYPDADAEVEKWKGLTDQEADDAGVPRSDHRALYVSHEAVDAADYVGVRAADLVQV
jgi:hypothetical protein